jgi:NADH-quinone oxidoreductase subunit A
MVGFAFFASRLIAPKNPTPEKLTSYECGEDTIGSAWVPFNSRFYVIALIFLLFDVEMIFILPWATVFGNRDAAKIDNRWGWLSLTEMFVFLGVLILGLVYVWVKGDLDWIKPKPVKPTVDTRVPASFYEKLNKQQSHHAVKEFSLEMTVAANTATTSANQNVPGNDNAQPIRKPMFKPTFKKPGNES